MDGPVTLRHHQFKYVKEFLKGLVSHMSIDNGDFMVSIIQLGDKGKTDIHLDFSDKLTKSKLLFSIDTLKQQGAAQKFDVRAFETAGYEVRFETACICYG